MVNLLDMPDLPLLHILLYLDYESLISLSAVCHRLRNFVDLDRAWFKYVVKQEDRLSFSNTCSLKSCCKDQCSDLPLRRKYFITRRLSCKDCGRRRVMKQFRSTPLRQARSNTDPFPREIYGVPRMSKCGSKVWISCEKELKKLQFADVHDCVAPMSETSYKGSQSDIRQIVHWNSFVTACCLNGQLLVWNSQKHEAPIDCQQVSSEPLITCDFDEEMIAVTSADEKLTVYRMEADCKTSRVWSTGVEDRCAHVVALRPFDARKLLVSSYSIQDYENEDVIKIYDVQSGVVDKNLHSLNDFDKNLYAVHWETFSTLITVGNYDIVRIWDLRTNSCVVQWQSTVEDSIYLTTVRGDGSNAVVVGGGTQELIRVLDRRRFTEPFRSWKRINYQKVYDIAVDMTHICYAVYDSINVIDFNY